MWNKSLKFFIKNYTFNYKKAFSLCEHIHEENRISTMFSSVSQMFFANKAIVFLLTHLYFIPLPLNDDTK